MVRFYDPIDNVDQRRVERLLRRGGIEYALREEVVTGLGESQILIAGEDLPAAEQLLARSLH